MEGGSGAVSVHTARVSRRTKIVATIGPACDDADALDRLFAAGTDVCRLNLSHGPVEEHLRNLASIRAAAERTGRPVAVLADLPGPKLRSGPFPDGGVDLAPGHHVELSAGTGPSTATSVVVGYPPLLAELEPGDRVVLGDGAISMAVTAVGDEAATAEILSGGRAQGRPGVHLSCEGLTLRAPTPTDLELAEVMAAAGVDFIALSFARQAADVESLRAVVGDRARIMAKIETASALSELGDIVAASDAVMVARGDLGIDCPLEDVPHLQKQIIRHCVEAGVPVVTATQMLESMIDAPSPTRAEVSDVANAVFDGTDAVMLSGETAIGINPARVVTTMATIAERAEAEADYRAWGARLGRVRRAGNTADVALSDRITESITHAAWQAASDVGAAAIICCTRTGRVARAMARFRPTMPLLAMSPSPATRGGLALSWGVETMSLDEVHSTDEMVWLAVEKAVTTGRVPAGSVVLVIAGAPDRHSDAAADVIRLVSVD